MPFSICKSRVFSFLKVLYGSVADIFGKRAEIEEWTEFVHKRNFIERAYIKILDQTLRIQKKDFGWRHATKPREDSNRRLSKSLSGEFILIILICYVHFSCYIQNISAIVFCRHLQEPFVFVNVPSSSLTFTLYSMFKDLLLSLYSPLQYLIRQHCAESSIHSNEAKYMKCTTWSKDWTYDHQSINTNLTDRFIHYAVVLLRYNNHVGGTHLNTYSR